MRAYRPSTLHALGIRAKKSLSQNFLIDKNIIQKMSNSADIRAGDSVLEIGSGLGAITQHLLEIGAHVIAIEKDKELAQNLCSSKNLTLFCEDALTFPYESIPQNTKIISNLPFQIAIPLIEKWISHSHLFSSATFIVQREVGEKMVAKKNTAEYGRLSLFIQSYSIPDYVFTIKPNSFYPKPSVESCLIHAKFKPFPFSFPEEDFFRFTKLAFSQKRKMLRSTLKTTYPHIEKMLNKPTSRPQELSLEEFAALFQKISNYKYKNSKPLSPIQALE